MHIAHVALWTTDLDRAAAFWERYFGATVGPLYESKRRHGLAIRWVTLPGNGQVIELMTGPWVEKTSQPTEQTGWTHVAIGLGSKEAVDALAARCLADGLNVAEPRTTGEGYYEAVVSLHDGTTIELTP